MTIQQNNETKLSKTMDKTVSTMVKAGGVVRNCELEMRVMVIIIFCLFRNRLLSFLGCYILGENLVNNCGNLRPKCK